MRELHTSPVEVLAVRGPRSPRQPGPAQVQIKQLYRYPEHRPPARRPADPASEPDWTSLSSQRGCESTLSQGICCGAFSGAPYLLMKAPMLRRSPAGSSPWAIACCAGVP
jgi:hypothetical protein